VTEIIINIILVNAQILYKLFKLESTSRTAISHKFTTTKLIENRFQRRIEIKQKLVEPEDKC